jgi:hypothetical protein
VTPKVMTNPKVKERECLIVAFISIRYEKCQVRTSLQESIYSNR